MRERSAVDEQKTVFSALPYLSFAFAAALPHRMPCRRMSALLPGGGVHRLCIHAALLPGSVYTRTRVVGGIALPHGLGRPARVLALPHEYLVSAHTAFFTGETFRLTEMEQTRYAFFGMPLFRCHF